MQQKITQTENKQENKENRRNTQDNVKKKNWKKEILFLIMVKKIYIHCYINDKII